MPLQNRVDPFGRLLAIPERGTFMGNRGVLHDAEQRIVREWRGRRWIICVLQFKGRHRAVMQPGRWTELFFLDEPTALAAGHRPCFECRRPDALRYREGWRDAGLAAALPSVAAMDDALHAARLGERHRAPLETLPPGTMVGEDGAALLVGERALHRWSPAGYDVALPRRPGVVEVLTPEPTVAVLAAGYPFRPYGGRFSRRW